MENIESIVQRELQSASPDEEFKYGKDLLGPDEIRLLLLLPDYYEEDGKDIHCYLTRLDLQATQTLDSKKHPFIALSYVWGPTDPQEKIFVNGRAKSVNPGLYQALKHIRDAMAPVPLWIDAICINQEDMAERSREVRKMKRIYAECSTVLYWLGPSEDDFDYGSGFRDQYGTNPAGVLAEFGDVYNELCKQGQENNHNAFESWQSLHLHKRPDMLYRLNECLSYFLSLPFWRRVWITQEFVLSTNGFFMWGFDIFDIKVLDGLLMIQDQVTPRKPYSLDFYQFQKVYAMMLGTVRMRSKTVRLIGALINVRYRLAGMELDYIYGMLGIVDLPGLEPNYEKPKKEVYLRAFEQVLIQENNLDILSTCDRGWAKCSDSKGDEDKENWPTWLPDWSYAPLKADEEEGEFKIPLRSLVLDFHDHMPMTWKAAADTKKHAAVLEDGSRLQLRGIQFDQVRDVLGPIGGKWQDKVIELWRQGRLNSAYKDLRSLEKVCHKTALYGRHLGLIPEDFPNAFKGQDESLGTKLDTSEMSPSFNEDGDSDTDEDQTIYRQTLFNLVESESTIFVTSRGLIGRCPNTVQTGDEVCIFLGAKVPFLLRPKAGTDFFELAGEACKSIYPSSHYC